MKTSEFDEYGECQECGSKEVLELEEYTYFDNLKGKMVLFLGSEYQEPVYCMFKSFNCLAPSSIPIKRTSIIFFSFAMIIIFDLLIKV